MLLANQIEANCEFSSMEIDGSVFTDHKFVLIKSFCVKIKLFHF